jgi:type II secretory pathway pseudopilin PulG
MMRARFDNPENQKQAAFTLVEIVVGLGLLTVLITMLFTVLGTAQQTVGESKRAANIHENARLAFQFLRDEVLKAKPPYIRGDMNPGQMFIIKNNANGNGDDELWFTTGSGTDDLGNPIRKNVRYYVDADPNFGLKVLKRQEFPYLDANPSAFPAPNDQNSSTICEYVVHFDVQYLSFKETNKKPYPDKFLPDLDDDTPMTYNFRNPWLTSPVIWKGSGLPNTKDNVQSSPPAIRITLVVRERLGWQTYFFQRVFLVPMSSYDPNIEEIPAPTAPPPKP